MPTSIQPTTKTPVPITNHAADRLMRLSNKIMKTWEKRSIDEVRAALPNSSVLLQNSLPNFLNLMATALSTTVDRTKARVKWVREENSRIGKEHGKNRALNSEYSIDQLIFEYHILRQVIFDVMEEEEELTPIQREVITCAIEQAVNDAVTQYNETHRDIREALANALAHDLRGPITSSKLNAQLIIKNPDNSDQNTINARRISTSMDRLDLMIHDLLDASRLRAGEKLEMMLEDCDLNEILNQVSDEENFLNDNKIKINSQGSVIGRWNKNALYRVIDNLITNALKYSEPKSSITMTLTRSDQEVVVTVHNKGNPIAPEEIPTLFQKFKRASSAEGKIGWGLGLMVVKGITEAHGGRVEVESSSSTGTIFKIILPLNATNISSSTQQMS